jgi:hypothetical protein
MGKPSCGQSSVEFVLAAFVAIFLVLGVFSAAVCCIRSGVLSMMGFFRDRPTVTREDIVSSATGDSDSILQCHVDDSAEVIICDR